MNLRTSRRAWVLGALALSCAWFPASARADIPITITSCQNKVNWTASVDIASPTAPVTYLVYRSKAQNVDPLASGVAIATTPTTSLGIGGGHMVGTQCFRVLSSDTVSGVFDNTVFAACHSFLHDTGCGNNDATLRADGNGTQLGFNELWNIGYFLDADSLVSLTIYPPGTSWTGPDVNGLFTPNVVPAPGVIKKIVDTVPRSGELADGSFKNQETWDSRDTTGKTVANGIYFTYFSITTPNTATGGQTTRYQEFAEIPVDLIRFTAFTTAGITPTVAAANINYTITGDAAVRVVIGKPGTVYTIDAAGNIQATVAANVVNTFTFNRRAGTYTETWNGTDSNGTAVSSGVYSVGISAVDGFGNQALNLAGNNGPLATTIPVDRTAAQVGNAAPPPAITAINFFLGGVAGAPVGINPVLAAPTFTGGTLAGSYDTIVFTMNVTAGPGITLNLTGPGGVILALGPPTSIVGTAVNYVLAAVQAAAGAYNGTIAAKDTNGNTANQTFGYSIPAAGAVTPPGLSADTFKASVIAFPNPTTAAPAKINFTLPAGLPASVDFDAFTLTGERLFHQSLSYPAGGAQQFKWNLVNDAANKIGTGVYLFRLTATDGKTKVRVTKKLMVVQ